jgi:hypothetical protein
MTYQVNSHRLNSIDRICKRGKKDRKLRKKQQVVKRGAGSTQVKKIKHTGPTMKAFHILAPAVLAL